MYREALRPWTTDELMVAPYSERLRPDPRWWDEMVERALARAASAARRLGPPGRRIVRATQRHRARLAALDDAGLAESAAGLRVDLIAHGFRLDLVGAAFAHVREATRRHLGIEHHPVQLMGGYVMLRGRLAEMQTGEGKTITAMLPAAAAALAGMPVHVVTVNDYLAKRDAEELMPIYGALGLSVGLVQHGQEPPVRGAAYRSDIVYCTNKELAFDYLRDRIASRDRSSERRDLAHRLLGPGESGAPLLLRGLHFAIVDEADSVLIDEARTPLIISAPNQGGAGVALYAEALALASQLDVEADFHIRIAEKLVYLTPRGRKQAAALAQSGTGIWRSRRAREELLTQALSALHVFRRDHQYIVADGKVQIVDEYTGRVMADRQWQRGLQQLIEMKEGCESSDGRDTLAQITYQRFFRRYLWLSGMSGTAMEVGSELRSIYRLRVARVPTHRPGRRRHRATRFLRSSGDRWAAVVASTRDMVAAGRPVLIGTRSVAASELVAGLLVEAGIGAVVLNARQDKDEAQAIAAAGLAGRVTVATNIAGRGTDIRPSPDVIAAGGLHVILTEFHESARIDRQLIGRTGRQGDPGSYEALASLEDELFTGFVRREAAFVLRSWPFARVPRLVGAWLRREAQRRAERSNARIRRETFKRGSEQERALAFASWAE